MKGVLFMIPEGIDVEEFYERSVNLELKYFSLGIYTLHVPDEQSMNFVQRFLEATKSHDGSYTIKKER